MSPRPNVITPKAKKSILAKFPFSSSPPFFSPNRTCRTIFPESLPPTPFTKQGTWKNIAFRFRDILRGPLMPLWQAFFLWGGTPCFSSGLEDRGRKQLLLAWLVGRRGGGRGEGGGGGRRTFLSPPTVFPFFPSFPRRKGKERRKKTRQLQKYPSLHLISAVSDPKRNSNCAKIWRFLKKKPNKKPFYGVDSSAKKVGDNSVWRRRRRRRCKS